MCLGIDKSSSAELSESINSMYNWYRRAGVCYVYLADVPGDATGGQENPAFPQSRWFTRGWTLQELIAPANVLFFAKDWSLLGTKIELRPILMKITGIHEEALKTSDMEKFSIAQRMSWASKRVTTRPEDISYCLMGIFNVNMPLLYGEGGEKAFVRLQEELLKSSDDQSLFAWGTVDPKLSYEESTGGLLAKSPASFTRFGNVVPIQRSLPNTRPSSTTNKGVQLSIPLIYINSRHHSFGFSGLYTALLECQFEGDMRGQVGILLMRVYPNGEQFLRSLSDPKLIPLRRLTDANETTIYIKDNWEIIKERSASLPINAFFVIPTHPKVSGHYKLFGVFPQEGWNEDEGLFALSRPMHGGSQTYHLVFSYTSVFSSKPGFVVILEYKHLGMIDIIGMGEIEISRDEGTPLKTLYENHRDRSLIQNKGVEAASIFEQQKHIGGVNIQIEIRRAYIFGKSLWLVCISAG